MDLELFGMKKVELSANHQSLVDGLKAYNNDKNYRIINDIIQGIEFGMVDQTKLLCHTQLDKLRGLPEVVELLKQHLFVNDPDNPFRTRKRTVQ